MTERKAYETPCASFFSSADVIASSGQYDGDNNMGWETA